MNMAGRTDLPECGPPRAVDSLQGLLADLDFILTLAEGGPAAALDQVFTTQHLVVLEWPIFELRVWATQTESRRLQAATLAPARVWSEGERNFLEVIAAPALEFTQIHKC